jgi:hypothetical protein
MKKVIDEFLNLAGYKYDTLTSMSEGASNSRVSSDIIKILKKHESCLTKKQRHRMECIEKSDNWDEYKNLLTKRKM